MSLENTAPQKPSFGRRLWLAFKNLFLFLLRALLTVLILGAIAAALYYGTPVLYREYFMRDVDINRSRIHDLNTQLNQNTEFFTQRLEDLRTRLATLETQRDSDKQTISDLETQLAEADAQLQDQASSLETLDVLKTSLDGISAQITTLESELTSHEESFDEIYAQVEGLNQSMEDSALQIDALNAQLAAQVTLIALRQQLELLKAMELVTRAQVSIGQDNTGLARQDIESALNLLTTLSTEVSATQADYLADVISRLELTRKNLSGSPTLAHQDLEVAWQLLLEGLPEEAPAANEISDVTPTPTPTPAGEEGETPTPTPTPSS